MFPWHKMVGSCKSKNDQSDFTLRNGRTLCFSVNWVLLQLLSVRAELINHSCLLLADRSCQYIRLFGPTKPCRDIVCALVLCPVLVNIYHRIVPLTFELNSLCPPEFLCSVLFHLLRFQPACFSLRLLELFLWSSHQPALRSVLLSYPPALT